MSKIAVRSGYSFGLVPESEVINNHISLIHYLEKVYINEKEYILHHGTKWEDVQKIDKLLDTYGDYPLDDYLR